MGVRSDPRRLLAVDRALLRSTGVLTPRLATGTSDHACCGYDSEAERDALATGWLRQGLRLRQRAILVTDDEAAAADDAMRADPELAAALDEGELVILTATEVYGTGTAVDLDGQLAVYDGMVRDAIAADRAGLRVAADITPLVVDPDRRAFHLRWEQVSERYATDNPFAALCFYDARRVPELHDVACAHPLRAAGHPPFAVYGSDPRGTTVVGEVDRTGGAAFSALLGSIPRTDTTLDLTRLDFVDGHAAWQLHEALQQRRSDGNPLVVTGTSPFVRRIWDLCRFDPQVLAVR